MNNFFIFQKKMERIDLISAKMYLVFNQNERR